jgi:hypothetical protein
MSRFRSLCSLDLAGFSDRLLAEFQGMWEKMLRSLKDQHKEIFRDEIQYRLDYPGEFKHCGTLSKEVIT